MKNIPDKIYVQLPSNKWIGRTWDETPIKEGDNPNWKNATNIEYVRKDAFIEKACEYFRNKKKCVFACIGEDVYHSLLNEEEIDDFKKYMKGE